ncbi:MULTISPECIES: hypothetical protein [Methylomonas]|uniref:Uncharacterized protein n=1 Tax=Methylomonas koyamae TaxID=702114 RepID=A0AA91I4D0_9GAMM|nr:MULTISPECIES: hypothetical protein [Methylomonas]ANE57903.1 hypothetical protein AYM39_21645 [Methylomonas sp. DH-1]OAI24164.1 hypothetical protein A1356_15885 [Methylomonas koyamae]BBL60920.1 hypothetical protein MKFW12EY_45330 [Methylomonas koyamae]
MARRESTNDTEGFACPLDHHARHRSGFTCLPHWKNLNPIVIGVTSRKVGGNLGDINLIQDTFHSQFTDHLDTSAVATLPYMQACPERSRRGARQVRSLREAASVSTTLAGLLSQFACAGCANQQALLDQILDAWSDTSTLAATYGGHSLTINIQDVATGSAAYTAWADELTILEHFNGRTGSE